MSSLIYSVDEIKTFLMKFPYYHDFIKTEYDLDNDVNNLGTFHTDNDIIVIGDVHGDITTFINLLLSIGMISKDNNRYVWSGGNTYLVQTGDILDRKRFTPGSDEGTNPYEELEIIMFLFDLNSQALEVGGRVICVVGNHELMNLCGDFRYASEHHIMGCNNIVNKKRGREYLFSHNSELMNLSNRRDGEIEDILLSMKGKLRYIFYKFFYPIAKINNWIFVHAGLPIGLVNRWGDNTVSAINNIYKQYIYTDDNHMEQNYNDLFGDSGIFWTRKYGNCNGKRECKPCEDLDNILNKLNGRVCGGMVVGHTVKENIEGRCNDRLWCIDIALSKGFWNSSDKKNSENCLKIMGESVCVIP